MSIFRTMNSNGCYYIGIFCILSVHGDTTVVLHLENTRSIQLQSFYNFDYPTLPVSFGGDNVSRLSLLSGVYARE